MRAAQSIIKRPLLTEKSQRLRETGGASERPAEGEEYAQKIAFEVALDANKIEIRRAVEAIWKVKVAGVRTQRRDGKLKRLGRFQGRRPSWKKAIVTLAEGQSIPDLG